MISDFFAPCFTVQLLHAQNSPCVIIVLGSYTCTMVSMLKQARKALRDHLKRKGRGEAARLARECGVTSPLPGRWARGDKTPSGESDSREILERETGIPAHWWRRERSTSARETDQQVSP